MIVDLPDLASMKSFGQRVAARLKPGDVVALSGELGAGKTTLAREILRALGHVSEVPSPTFTIVEIYDDLSVPVVHADFYRLDQPEDTEELGLDEYREGAALIAEWPGQAGGFTREPACLSITLEFTGENRGGGRKAIVEPGADWLTRWP